MIKNTSGQKVGVQMVSATDGSAFTGSVTVAVTVDAGTQATGSVGSGACTHEGNGYHTYAPSQAETNGDLVAFTFTGTGAVPQTVQVYTRASAPDVNVTTYGGSAGTFSGGRPEVNVSHWKGTAAATVDTAGYPKVTVKAGTGTGELDVTSGVVKANLAQILGTALTETAGQIAAAFKQFFDVASPSGTMKAITAVTTVTNLTNAPTAGDFTSTMKTSLNSATPSVTVSDKTGFSLSSAGILAIWHQLTSAIVTSSTIGKLLVDNIDAAMSSRLASASYTAPLDAAGTRTAVGLASANLDTQLDALPTASENATALLDASNGIETGYTPRQVLRLISAVLLGKVSGGATTTNTFRDLTDSKDRVTATVDADGNRTAVTKDAS